MEEKENLSSQINQFVNESLDLFEKQVGPFFSSFLGIYQGVSLLARRFAQAIVTLILLK